MTMTQHATKAGKDFCNAMLTAAIAEHGIDGFIVTNLELLRVIVSAQRTAIHLVAKGGLTVSEIATALNIDESVVSKILAEDLVPAIAVGDIVRPIGGDQLRSGCESYGAAVCISVTPFVIVSERADMRWGGKAAAEMEIVGKASEELLAKCMTRL